MSNEMDVMKNSLDRKPKLRPHSCDTRGKR